MKRLEDYERTHYDQKVREGQWTSLKMTLGLPLLLILLLGSLGVIAYGLLSFFR